MIFIPKIIKANNKAYLQIDEGCLVTYDTDLRISVVTSINSKYPLTQSATGVKDLLDSAYYNTSTEFRGKVLQTLIFAHIVQAVIPFNKFWKIFIYNPGLVVEFVNTILADVYDNVVTDATILDVWEGIGRDEDNKRHTRDLIHSCYLDLRINEQVFVKIEPDQVSVARSEDSKERLKLSLYNLAGSNGITKELFKECVPALAHLVSAKMLISKLEQLDDYQKLSSSSIHSLESALLNNK